MIGIKNTAVGLNGGVFLFFLFELHTITSKELKFFGLNIFLFYLISVFTIFIVFFLFFVGLLIAANPYLAVKVYPDN